MTAQPVEPCPCEQSGRHSSLGPVGDAEVVVRFVPKRDNLVNEGGRPRLVAASFARDDIKGVGSGPSKRSVSSFRGQGKTPYTDLLARACFQNREPAWCEDPVVAFANVKDLRVIVDQDGRREICVYADRTLDDDPLGVCESHASIRKSSPADQKHNRQDIALLRSCLSDAFAEVRHLISGTSPPLPAAG